MTTPLNKMMTIDIFFSWLEFITFVERALPLPSQSSAPSPSLSRDGGGRGLETPPSRPVWETRQPLKGVSREGRHTSLKSTLDERHTFEEQQRYLGK